MQRTKPSLARRIVSTGAALALAAGGLVGMVGAGLALTSTTAGAAGPQCNFTIASGPGTVVGGQIITGIVAGSTTISADCNTAAGTGVVAEASALGGVGTSTYSAASAADIAAASIGFTASATDTGCPAATAGQCSVLTTPFAVPVAFAASDSNASCPPTQAQINAGLASCALAAATLTQVPVAEVLLNYASQTTPPNAPTIAPTTSTGVAGNTVTVADASGHTGYWSGSGIQAAQAVIDGGSATAAPTTCSPPAYGNVPNAAGSPFLAVNWINGATTIAGDATGVNISNLCYNGTSLSAPALSGSIPVPATVVPGTVYTVYLCELNTTGYPSNDANSTAHCGTPAVPGANFIDASFSYTVEGAATATASPTSGGVGTAVTVSVTGFDAQGTTVYAAFSTGSNTPAPINGAGTPVGPTVSGSAGTCGTVASNGNVTCSLSVTGVDTIGSNPIVIYQGDAGPTTTLNVPFNVTAISTTCSTAGPGTSCSIQQVITLQVNPGSLNITEANPNVTLSPITLNGSEQNSTGALNQVVVTDARGTLAGWTLVGQFSTDFTNATPSGNDNTILVSGASPLGFNWTPAVAPVTSTAGEVAAGAATTAGLSTTAPNTLCSAAAGGGGGITDCNAAVSLGVPSNVSAGSYSATLQLTIS